MVDGARGFQHLVSSKPSIAYDGKAQSRPDDDLVAQVKQVQGELVQQFNKNKLYIDMLEL